MRALVGFVCLQGLLAFAGLGVLRALGLLGPGARAAAPAMGAALLSGTSLVIMALIALLVVGVPLTLGTTALVGFVIAGVGFALARRRSTAAAPVAGPGSESAGVARIRRVVMAAACAYVAIGAYALARAPTRSDDARIWSLKGLTLTYYDTLRPEMFLNPATSLGHPVYPLFQPVLEAVLGRAMGQPSLRLFHTELWLLLATAIWTAAYLIWWRCSRPLREQVGLVLLALLAITPTMVTNISTGFADATGAMLLTTGAVAVGLWLDGRSRGHLWLGAILLAAAGNTKDEDMVGAALVLGVAGIVLAAGAERRRLRSWLGGAFLFAALILPWRIWTLAHHLSDNVVPPLPRAQPRVRARPAPATTQNGDGDDHRHAGRVGLARRHLPGALRPQPGDGNGPATRLVLCRELRGARRLAALALHPDTGQPRLPHPHEHESHGDRVHGADSVRLRPPPGSAAISGCLVG